MEERGHLHPLKDETASAPLSCRLLFSLDHTINDNNMHTTQLLLDVKVRLRGSMQSMPKTLSSKTISQINSKNVRPVIFRPGSGARGRAEPAGVLRDLRRLRPAALRRPRPRP